MTPAVLITELAKRGVEFQANGERAPNPARCDADAGRVRGGTAT